MAETALALGYEIAAFAAHDPQEPSLLGVPILPISSLDDTAPNTQYVVAIGDNFSRQAVWSEITQKISSDRFPVLIHPSALISQLARIEVGTVVLQGAIVGSMAQIGVGCLVNSGAVVEHECALGDFASVGPNSTMGGRVHLGSRSSLSIGAVVKHGLTIGSDTVVGSASYVHRDMPNGVVAFGSPANIVRTRQPSDSYLN